MATSYICEHTAEYYLVPAMKKILLEKYSHVAPVFPWLSRELSRISRHLHKYDQFHVLVIFPRRPKINGHDDGEIYITLNQELVNFVELGKVKGVPTIAGCPRALNLWDLSISNNYAWLRLDEINYHKNIYSINDLEKN